MAQVRKFAPGGTTPENKVEYTGKLWKNGEYKTGTDALKWMQTELSGLDTDGTVQRGIAEAIKAGHNVEITPDRSIVITDENGNDTTENFTPRKAARTNDSKWAKDWQAFFNTDKHKQRVEADALYRANFSPTVAATAPSTLIKLNKGNNDWWAFDKSNAYLNDASNAGRMKILDDWADYFKLGKEEGGKKYDTSVLGEPEIDALHAWYANIDPNYFEVLKERIKAGTTDETDESTLKMLGFLKNIPEESEEDKAKRAAIEAGTKLGLSADEVNNYFVLGEDGRLHANDRFLTQIARLDGSNDSGNYYFNDIFNDKYNRNGIYDHFKEKMMIDGTLYDINDADLLPLITGYYNKNKAGDFVGANNDVLTWWGATPTQGNAKYYDEFASDPNHYFFESQYTPEGLNEGERVVSWYDLNDEVDPVTGLRKQRFNIVDANGKLGAEYNGDLLNGNTAQALDLSLRGSLDPKNSIYYNSYVKPITYTDPNTGEEKKVFDVYLNGDQAIFQIPDDRKGQSENFRGRGKNNNIAIPREIYDLIDKNPNIWNKISRNEALREKFFKLLSGLTYRRLNKREGINTRHVGTLLGLSGTDLDTFVDFFKQYSRIGNRLLITVLPNISLGHAKGNFDWDRANSLVDKNYNPAIEEQKTVMEKLGGNIPKFLAGGINKGVNNTHHTEVTDYNSGAEAAKLDGSDHLTSADKMQIAALITDIGGLAGSFAPGVGSAVGLGTGLASAGLNTAAAIKRDGFQLRDLGTLGLGAGLAALSIIPGAAQAAKLGSISKTMVSLVPRLVKAGVISLGVGAAGASAAKAMKGETLDLHDLTNLAGALRIAVGGGAAAKRNLEKAKIGKAVMEGEPATAAVEATAKPIKVNNSEVKLTTDEIASIKGKATVEEAGAALKSLIKSKKIDGLTDEAVDGLDNASLLSKLGIGAKRGLFHLRKPALKLPKEAKVETPFGQHRLQWARNLIGKDNKQIAKIIENSNNDEALAKYLKTGTEAEQAAKINALGELVFGYDIKTPLKFRSTGAAGWYGGRRWTLDPQQKSSQPLLLPQWYGDPKKPIEFRHGEAPAPEPIKYIVAPEPIKYIPSGNSKSGPVQSSMPSINEIVAQRPKLPNPDIQLIIKDFARRYGVSEATMESTLRNAHENKGALKALVKDGLISTEELVNLFKLGWYKNGGTIQKYGWGSSIGNFIKGGIKNAYDSIRLGINHAQVKHVSDLQKKAIRDANWHQQNVAEVHPRTQIFGTDEIDKAAADSRRHTTVNSDSTANRQERLAREGQIMEARDKTRVQNAAQYLQQLDKNTQRNAAYAEARTNVANQNTSRDAATRAALDNVDDATATQHAHLDNTRMAEISQNIGNVDALMKQAAYQKAMYEAQAGYDKNMKTAYDSAWNKAQLDSTLKNIKKEDFENWLYTSDNPIAKDYMTTMSGEQSKLANANMGAVKYRIDPGLAWLYGINSYKSGGKTSSSAYKHKTVMEQIAIDNNKSTLKHIEKLQEHILKLINQILK